jgi:CheY-like chemotaxis protein
MTALGVPEFQGRVLVVDADYDVLGSLSNALRRRGHHVVLAADGRTGLSRAVEVAAEVVLVDRDVPVLDVRTFLEVLRDNPRTSSTETFLMGTGEPSRLAAIDARAQPIVKPFNAEEVAARVDDVLRKRFGPQIEPELSGDLAQVALFDLLQVFSANRRTGRLELDARKAAGRVWVEDGRIVDATFGGVAGEKALYRILGAREGTFVFYPDAAPEHRRIDAHTDQLLMEGARQSDEVARLGETLPGFGALVSISVAPNDPSPLAAAIVEHLDEPRAIEELLDRVQAPDLEILGAVRELAEEGALLVFDPEGDRLRFAGPDEAIALRAGASRLRRPGLEGPFRLPILAPTTREVARFARALARVDGFVSAARPPTAAGSGALGHLGVLRLEGTDVELLVLPLDPELRPLWGPLLEASTVALMLGEGDEPSIEALLKTLEVRLVHAPAGWDRPQGARQLLRSVFTNEGRSMRPPE